MGNRIVQENDINWSKRILGKEALTQIKTNTIIQDLIPRVKPYIIPSINGYENTLNISSGILAGSGVNIKKSSRM